MTSQKTQRRLCPAAPAVAYTGSATTPSLLPGVDCDRGRLRLRRARTSSSSVTRLRSRRVRAEARRLELPGGGVRRIAGPTHRETGQIGGVQESDLRPAPAFAAR